MDVVYNNNCDSRETAKFRMREKRLLFGAMMGVTFCPRSEQRRNVCGPQNVNFAREDNARFRLVSRFTSHITIVAFVVAVIILMYNL